MFKRTIKILTLAVLIIAGGSVTAQIMEYKTIDGEYIQKTEYCNDVCYQLNDNILKIYNLDFECIKTVTLPAEKEWVRIHCLSKNIITNSNKYEFIAVNDGEDGRYGVLFNEDGQKLYEWSRFYSDSEFWDEYNPFIIGNKLVVKVGGDGDRNKIYTLANSINSGISQAQQKNSSKLYPNPARQAVTLEYDIQGQMQEMQIVDMQGRVVANYLLDPSQKQVKINTSNYKKGVYIYRYGNNSGKFVVE